MEFFGIVVKFEEGVTICLDVDSKLHISQAVLGEPRVNCVLEDRNVLFCQVGDTAPIAIASLRHKRSEMVNLDIHFERPVKIKFSVQGTRDVYVSGSYHAQAPHTIMASIPGAHIGEKVLHVLNAPLMEQDEGLAVNKDIGGVEKEAHRSVEDVVENTIASGGEKLAFESSGMQTAHVEQSRANVDEIVDKSGVVGINEEFEDVAEKNLEDKMGGEKLAFESSGMQNAHIEQSGARVLHEIGGVEDIVEKNPSSIPDDLNVVEVDITKQEMKKKKKRRKELTDSEDDDDETRFVLSARPETSTMVVETPIVADFPKPKNDCETAVEKMSKPKKKKKRTEMGSAVVDEQVNEETEPTPLKVVSGLCAVPKTRRDSVDVGCADEKSKPKHVLEKKKKIRKIKGN